MILDHLTIADAIPSELINIACGEGYSGVGVFLHNVPGVPGMAEFDIITSKNSFQEFKNFVMDGGCEIALAYPFNLTRTSTLDGFDPMLDAAAGIGARAVNLLVFDRDVARRAEAAARFCERAADRGLLVGLEFYPPSAVRSLEEAVDLCDLAGAPNLKLTVDLLHLHRSGGSLEALAAQQHRILIAQVCDALIAAPDDLFYEAAADRLLPGEGALDPAAFLRACGRDTPVSIEAPCTRLSHLPPAERARMALNAMRDLIGAPEAH